MEISEGVRLVAPTLIRSQLLSMLHARVRAGEISEADAKQALAYARGLQMRLLGDRVLQDVAWQMATELDLGETFDGEYIALTRLQADALITVDSDLSRAASGLVTVATIEDLIAGAKPS